MKDKPRTPLETTADWIEYVLRHGGAQHLRAQVFNIHWYQYYLIDVIAFLVSVVTLVVMAIWKTCRCFCRLCCKRNGTKSKNEWTCRAENSFCTTSLTWTSFFWLSSHYTRSIFYRLKMKALTWHFVHTEPYYIFALFTRNLSNGTYNPGQNCWAFGLWFSEMLTKFFLLWRGPNLLHDLFTAIINCDENNDYFRSKDASVHLIFAIWNDEWTVKRAHHRM